MLELVVAALTGNAGAHLRRFARLVVFAAVTFVFVAIALAAGAAALYMALDAWLGPMRAALVLAAGALVCAGLVSLPLWRKAEPKPSTASSLAELGLAVALGLMASRKAKKEQP